MKVTRLLALLAVVGMVLGACAPAPTVETITVVETVEVPVEVVKTVEVPVQVEVEVPAEIETVHVAMGYIPNHQFAPFYVAFDNDYFTDEGLVVMLDAGNEFDAVAMVAEGRFQFGIASVDTVLFARSQGIPVKYVLRWYNGWPTTIFSLAETGINKPEDLVGKTVGFPGPFGANWTAWLLFLNEVGLSADDVDAQMIGWTQSEMVSTGQVDAAAGYTVNEPILLRSYGLEINELVTNDYVSVAPIGIFASEEFIANNPEVVQGFVTAFLKGVEKAVSDPGAAVGAVFGHVPVDWSVYYGEDPGATIFSQIMADIAFWTGPGPYDAASIEDTMNAMIAVGMLSEAIPVEDTFTNEFVEAAGY